MRDLPSGTVTFLFTDIEDSTRLWESDRAAMHGAVDRHLALLGAAVERHGGVLFKIVGDGTQAAFASASGAIAAALDAQRTILAEPWPRPPGPLRVRMALHAGEATPRDGDFLAAPLNRLSRLLGTAHGGHVLLTQAVQQLVRDGLPPGAALHDLGEARFRDLREPERVFQLLHPDLPPDLHAPRLQAVIPHNLPVFPTPFVGREEQVSRLTSLLREDDVRLLTVTGPGGVGKTRLALHVATGLFDAFPDGIWFVDLSPLTDPALVPSAIAIAIGLREEGSGLERRLAGYMAARRMLLVLDNCERVVDAAPLVHDLLAEAPGLRVLVTSRTPLHVYGEQEFPLAPFPLPDPARLSLEQLTQLDAVRLFSDRARAVVEICSRLDGLPLAIELVAVRVKILPPLALLKRLEQRLPLLTGGARTLPSRQQTMRNAIAWSHDLLAPEERFLFRRLAVFPAGCALEAAEAVAGEDGSLDVFAAITALIDDSLLRQEEDPSGEPRLRMLETVREFALEMLEKSGEGEFIRERQAAWCLSLAEAAESDLNNGRRHRSWNRRLDIELPNIRAAITWLLGHGKAASVLRLFAATHEYWMQRHHYAEIRAWLQEALDAAPDAPSADRAMAPDLQAFAAVNLGDLDAAINHARQAVEEANKAGDPFSLGLAQVTAAFVSEHRGDACESIPLWEEAVRLMRAAENAYFVAATQLELGDKLVRCGELAAGVHMLDEALDTLRQSGDNWPLTVGLGERAYAALAQRDLATAARLFDESLSTALADGSERIALVAAAGLAGVALARGEAERAGRLLGAVDASRQRGGVGGVGISAHAERIESSIKGSPDEAAFDRAYAAGRALTPEEMIAAARAIAAEMSDVPAGATHAR